MQMIEMTQRIKENLHPDALYDDIYAQTEKDISSYLPFTGDFSPLTDSKGVTLSSAKGCVRIDAWADGIIRLRIDPNQATPSSSPTEDLGLLEPRPAPPAFKCRQEGAILVLETALLSLRIDSGTGGLELLGKGVSSSGFTTSLLKSVPDAGVRFDSRSEDRPAFYAEFEHEDREAFHGFGGRIAPPNRTGQTADIFSVKTGKRSGDFGGFPLPYFISSKGYGFFLNNPWPHVYFDMAHSAADRWSLHSPGGPCDIFFMAGPSQPEVVQRFTSIVGRPASPARWLFGFWCCSLGFASGEQAIKDAKRLRSENYPCDVFVFDGPWRSGLNFINSYATGHDYPSCDFDWHPDFGDGPGMVRELASLGIKTGLHVNSRSFSPDATQSGLAAGLLRQHGEEVVPRVGNSEAEAHYISLLKPRMQENVALWWTDHADRVSGELEPGGLPSRNLFGPLWNRTISRMMDQQGDNCPMSLSRGGGIGSQRYALPWPGDTRCGVDALIDDLWFVINAGLSGFPFTSADLGGFAVRGEPGDPGYETLAERDAEMFDDENIARRVCQALLYIPLPRIHNNWETTPKFPWNCSKEIQPLYKKAIDERYALTPYWYHYALNAVATGEPILRPLVYHHPDDAAALACDDQFYLGEDLMMAPAYREGEEKRMVYLPAGKWTHYWTGEHHCGPAEIEVATPLMSLEGVAVFIRDGSIIPRQPVTPSLGNKLPEELSIDLYPAEVDSQRALNEGECITEITCSPQNDGLQVTLANGSSLQRRFNLRIHSDESYGTPEIEGAEETSSSSTSVNASLPPGARMRIRWQKA